ncbi:LANO_0D06590g1_1 [Lachancea nothofagi CBS 11611]|uniref:LANO_0D06590g1_1 n=1 Tax=Lachancea nothofagi CBS 11611 TaxID=1266666 RepID=A0A1G4JHU8_9SACH|nr:LANO_0D06590g1_1 [Lachancea nothofagi CBS 11611]
MVWDPLEFLKQPITLRKCVYWHLDGQLTQLNLPSAYQLFTNTFIEHQNASRKSKQLKNLRKRLQHFAEFFSYMPAFVNSWLQYVACLRYDCVALDYMRINRELEGTLSPLEWIVIDGQPQLGFFSPSGLLQLWYSTETYRELIDDELRPATVLNTEHLYNNELQTLSGQLDNQEIKDLVQGVHFCQDEESGVSDEILKMISILESLKNLQVVKVTGDTLFERLINFHGFRDHPGHTVGYMIKNRVSELEIKECTVIGTLDSIADLTRWERVFKVTFSRLAQLDLNRAVLPPGCRWLRLDKIRMLKWWDQEEIRSLLQNQLELRERIHYEVTKPKTWIVENATSAEVAVAHTCKALMWETMGHLNRMQLVEVGEIEPTPILPRSLYEDGRIEWCGSKQETSIILL